MRPLGHTHAPLDWREEDEELQEGKEELEVIPEGEIAQRMREQPKSRFTGSRQRQMNT